MPLSPKEAHQLEMAHSAANDAVRAIGMQQRRITGGSEQDDSFFESTGFRREVDVYFLLLALRWLHESCRLVARLTNDATLLDEIAEFERALPQARDMRDVREHVSDYIAGDGKLQRAKTDPDRHVRHETLGLRMWFGESDGSGFWWAGKEIRLGDVLPTAVKLYTALIQAMHRHVVPRDPA